MKSEKNYYEILGVHKKASAYELRKAFCKLSKELHPDTTNLELEDAKNKFQEVREAYENLNNTNLRNIYDEQLKDIPEKIYENNLNNFNSYYKNNDTNLVGNRRPFSNGEMFSLLLLMLVILLSLLVSILIASFNGSDIETIPIWLIR